jgi:hypothetical protein
MAGNHRAFAASILPKFEKSKPRTHQPGLFYYTVFFARNWYRYLLTNVAGGATSGFRAPETKTPPVLRGRFCFLCSHNGTECQCEGRFHPARNPRPVFGRGPVPGTAILRRVIGESGIPFAFSTRSISSSEALPTSDIGLK